MSIKTILLKETIDYDSEYDLKNFMGRVDRKYPEEIKTRKEPDHLDQAFEPLSKHGKVKIDSPDRDRHYRIEYREKFSDNKLLVIWGGIDTEFGLKSNTFKYYIKIMEPSTRMTGRGKFTNYSVDERTVYFSDSLKSHSIQGLKELRDQLVKDFK